MEELSENGRRTSRRTKIIIGFTVVMFLIVLAPAIIESPIIRNDYHGIVTLSSVESEISLHMDFYHSAEDANAGTNNFQGYAWGIDPSNEEQLLEFTVWIPVYSETVWVKIYFDEILETPSILLCLRVGQTVYSSLLDVDFRIYIQPNSA